MDEVAVKEQLRAGSILEAVRIRKIGYGYRMEYDDFGEKFWPIIGERVFEVDHNVIQIIFTKATQYVTEAQKVDLLPSQDQTWKIGTTKLFLKDSCRFAIEAALAKVRDSQATRIQSKMRQLWAKERATKRKDARDMITRNIFQYILRKRWRESIMNFAKQYKAIVVRLQRAFRKKRFRRQVMTWVAERRRQAILIQRVWRDICKFNNTLRVLEERKKARMLLQRVFLWRLRQKSVLKEIDRRVTTKTELKERLQQQAIQEAKEVNVLKHERVELRKQLETVQTTLVTLQEENAKLKEEAASAQAQAKQASAAALNDDGVDGPPQVVIVKQMEIQIEELQEENKKLKGAKSNQLQSAMQRKIITVLRVENSQIKQTNALLAQKTGIGAQLEGHGYY